MSEFRPLAGQNFYCREFVPLAMLARDLQKIVAFLQQHWPDAPLNQFADWWEHDGLHFFTEIIDFHRLFALIGSPQAIYEVMPGDDNVRIGIAPLGAEWYLRFYTAWDDDGEALEGDFDLTLPDNLADTFRAEIVPKLDADIEEEDAERYFKKIVL